MIPTHSLLPTLLLLLSACTTVFGLSNLQHANIDFTLLGGSISLFGAFDGASFYNAANASAFLTPQAPNTVGLYVRNTTSSAISTAASFDGQVYQTVPLTNDSVLVLGNFSHINGQPMLAPAIFNVTTETFTSIWPQNLKRDALTQGEVLSALVDGSLVYLGGNFQFNNTNSVAVYNLSSNTMQSTPFLGFGSDSVVRSIAKYAGDSNSNSAGSIVFGGDFDTLGLPQLLMHNVTFNVTVDNNTNSTNTSLVSAEQLVSLKHATFTSTNGAAGNSDASLICPILATPWSTLDNNGGQWAVELPNAMKGLTPTKVRIYLPDDSSNGIKTFRIYTYPNNGIMNLTYVDPITNQIAFCDAWCPMLQSGDLRKVVDNNKANYSQMSKNNSVFVNAQGSLAMYYEPGSNARNLGYGSNYQEFALVNLLAIDKIGLTSLAWYGDKSEFAGFELYQNQIGVYANNTLNDPNCGSLSDANSNRAQINAGSWQLIQLLNNAVTTQDYLVSIVQDSTKLSISLYPNISYAGTYSLLLYTPGCGLDGSCDKRGIINATVISANGSTVSTQQIYQNNLDDKFDFLYYGHLNASTSSRQNQIRLDFISAVNQGVQQPWMVANKAVANIVLLDTYYVKNVTNSSSTSNTTDSFILTMSLNGLFEYSIANFSKFNPALVYTQSDNQTLIPKTNTFVGNSTINVLSGNLSTGSTVSQVLVNGNSLTLLGSFLSGNISLSNNNLIALELAGYNTTLNETIVKSSPVTKRDTQSILGFPFNNTITRIYPYGTGAMLLGAFGILKNDIKNLAANNASTSTASNLAYFENGQLYSFGNAYQSIDYSNFLELSLGDIQYFVFSDNTGNYLTWDNTNKQWLTQNVVLNITTAISMNNVQIVAGSSFVSMATDALAGAHFSNVTSIQGYYFNVTNGSIFTSYYVNSSFAVIGGNFHTNLSGSNVALVLNNTLTPINAGASWGNSSMVTSLFVSPEDGLLYVGSNGSVTIGSASITGLSVYNLRNKTVPLIQPPDLSTNNGSVIEVNALALYEENKQLLVGGHFDRAGSLDCGTVCIYDTVNTRWLNPQSGSTSVALSGTVTDAKFISSNVALLSGKLMFNGSMTNFLTYNFASQSFASPPSEFASIDNGKTVTKFIINDNSNAQLKSRMIAMGSDFLVGFNGSEWSRIDSAINYLNTTILTDLKLVQLSTKTANNTSQAYFNSDKALMLSGTFTLHGYGLVNLAIYDGVSWLPFVFTLNSSKIGIVESISFQDIYRFQSSNDLINNSKHLSTGKVVGISLACALGSTAFLGLLYVIPLFFLMRESKKKEAMRKRISEDDMMNIVDPGDLLHEMDLQRNY